MQTPRGIAWLVLLATTSAVANPSSLSADLNDDGKVDAADLAHMRDVFFTSDARADLNGSGRVDFADLALLKAAHAGPAPDSGIDVPEAPAVFLLPETQDVAFGEQVAVDLYWDFTGEATVGGGTDISWDPAAFDLVSIVFDDNFGTDPGQFDPAFTYCDDEPCAEPGLINALSTGNFDGLGDPGPIFIARITFDTLAAGSHSIQLSEDDPSDVAGPFVSAIDFEIYPNLAFAGAAVEVAPPPPAPRIAVSPSSVGFPQTLVGDTSSVEVTVSSIGELPLSIAGVVPPFAPFTLGDDACTGEVLAPTETCALILEFSPPTVDSFASFIEIASNDPDRPDVEVTMSGEGIIAPQPDLQTRGRIVVDETRVGQTTQAGLGVANNGTDLLAIGDIAVANPVEAPFSIVTDNCSQRVLAPGNNCGLVLSFEPTEVRLFAGDFDIPSDDPDSPSTVVRVRGNAVARIGLDGAAIEGSVAECGNLTTGQQVTAVLNGGSRVACEELGLLAADGESLSLTIQGSARSADQLQGHALGMTAERVSCVNDTTGQSVDINPAAPPTNWNCVAAGLIVTPGDTVAMVVFGSAL